ncbi:hypothetical protein SE17_35940 [Kouleothrix aurantiaca]|uniref:N-acetyltransferase domain-containing protein n=1 Tax=Kouleothrix aurantiaca TaxID=186479 RepID=A0A0P9DFN8_9CHLR|nr:hypothetical protein SE17_35940 [Kouleothrix aurantiaca]
MVELRPMTDAEYADFLAFAVADYANEHVQAGDWAAEGALERSAAEFADLLPNGVASPGHHLFTIYDSALQTGVGMLWFAVRESAGKRVAFVYNLIVDEQYRRRGYASQAFLAMEPYVRALGLHAIRLHVFGHNQAAQALYAKLGYEVTNVLMQKTLDPR